MIKKSFTFILLNTFSNNFEKVIFNTSCHYKGDKINGQTVTLSHSTHH